MTEEKEGNQRVTGGGCFPLRDSNKGIVCNTVQTFSYRMQVTLKNLKEKWPTGRVRKKLKKRKWKSARLGKETERWLTGKKKGCCFEENTKENVEEKQRKRGRKIEGERERRNSAGGTHCQGHSSLLAECSCTRMISLAKHSVRCKRSEHAYQLYALQRGEKKGIRIDGKG